MMGTTAIRWQSVSLFCFLIRKNNLLGRILGARVNGLTVLFDVYQTTAAWDDYGIITSLNQTYTVYSAHIVDAQLLFSIYIHIHSFGQM